MHVNNFNLVDPLIAVVIVSLIYGGLVANIDNVIYCTLYMQIVCCYDLVI